MYFFSGLDRPQRLGSNPEKIQIIRLHTSFFSIVPSSYDTIHPRTVVTSGIFTTTGRILVYNNQKEFF
jgi:hypothetical protein